MTKPVKFTPREMDMARKGYVYHRYQTLRGMKRTVGNLRDYPRADLEFDHAAYDAAIQE